MTEENGGTSEPDSEPSWGAKELAGLMLEAEEPPFLYPLAKAISFVMESERSAFEEILEAHEAEFRKIGGMELYEKLLDAIDELRRQSNTPPRPSFGSDIAHP